MKSCDMDGLVTVIVPVYNTERFLPHCLGSIIGQSYRDLEIILVDDGSTDGSGRICDGYAAKDGRIKVLHKENEGVSIARNTGLAAASAPYVMFVDSDDVLAPGMLQAMMNQVQDTDPDLCVCGLRNFHEDRSADECWTYTPGIYTAAEYARVLLHFYTNPFVGGPVAKLYRRSLLEKVRM